MVHRETPVSKLVIAHQTKVRKWAVEDPNVAFPLDRMKELEAEGTIKRLAHTAVSMVGSIQRVTSGTDGYRRHSDGAIRFLARKLPVRAARSLLFAFN